MIEKVIGHKRGREKRDKEHRKREREDNGKERQRKTPCDGDSVTRN